MPIGDLSCADQQPREFSSPKHGQKKSLSRSRKNVKATNSALLLIPSPSELKSAPRNEVASRSPKVARRDRRRPKSVVIGDSLARLPHRDPTKPKQTHKRKRAPSPSDESSHSKEQTTPEREDSGRKLQARLHDDQLSWALKRGSFRILSQGNNSTEMLLHLPLTISASSTHNFQVIHCLVKAKVAAGLYHSAIKYCIDILLSWYSEANEVVQVLSDNDAHDNFEALCSVDSIRTGLAGMWCVYAQTLLSIRQHKNRKNSAMSQIPNPMHKGGRPSRDVPRDAITAVVEKESSALQHIENTNSQSFDKAGMSSAMKKCVSSVMLHASSCPIVGNHPWIFIALSRMQFLPSTEMVHEEEEEETAATLKEKVRSAIRICQGGIDKSNPIPRFQGGQISTSSHLECHQVEELLSHHCLAPTVADGGVPFSVLRESLMKLRSVIPDPLSAHSSGFLFRDTRGGRILCHEVNRLSRLLEQVSAASASSVRAKERRTVSLDPSYGIGCLELIGAPVMSDGPNAPPAHLVENGGKAAVNVTTAVVVDNPNGEGVFTINASYGNDDEIGERPAHSVGLSFGECSKACPPKRQLPEPCARIGNAEPGRSCFPIETTGQWLQELCVRDNTSDVDELNCHSATLNCEGAQCFGCSSSLVENESARNLGPGSACVDVETPSRHAVDTFKLRTWGKKRRKFRKRMTEREEISMAFCGSASFDLEGVCVYDSGERSDLLDYAFELFEVSKSDLLLSNRHPSRAEAGPRQDFSSFVPHFAGQVGLRCMFCRNSDIFGASDSFIFPRTRHTLCRDAWFLCLEHLDTCTMMPRGARQRYDGFRETTAMGSAEFREYWKDACTLLRSKRKGNGVRWSRLDRTDARS